MIIVLVLVNSLNLVETDKVELTYKAFKYSHKIQRCGILILY